jgi:hypothetical protein
MRAESAAHAAQEEADEEAHARQAGVLPLDDETRYARR